MSILQYVLVKAGLAERRKDGRVPASGLDVSYWTGREQKRARIKDISATGIFLLTGDRWLPGATVQLTLQKHTLLERESRPQLRLRARCVRLGDDGVGLTFVEVPERAGDWSRSMAIAAELLAASHPIRLFRATKALAFLLRICPPVEMQLRELLTGISAERLERVIDVALAAEELLVSRDSSINSVVSPSLVMRILEYASKGSDDQVQSWAGLLASSCSDQTTDDSMGRFVVLLSRLDRDHIAVLTTACSMALRAGWEPGFVFSSALWAPVDEIRKITHVRNPAAIERNLNHLHQLGLLEKTVRPLGCAQLEQVNITPTALGLNLYVRCCGQPEVPEVLESSTLEMAS